MEILPNGKVRVTLKNGIQVDVDENMSEQDILGHAWDVRNRFKDIFGGYGDRANNAYNDAIIQLQNARSTAADVRRTGEVEQKKQDNEFAKFNQQGATNVEEQSYLDQLKKQISPEALASLDQLISNFYGKARGEAQTEINRQVAAGTGRAASRFAQASSFGSPAEEYTYQALERAGQESLAPQLAQLGLGEASARQRGKEFTTQQIGGFLDALRGERLTREQMAQRGGEFVTNFREGQRQFNVGQEFAQKQLDEQKRAQEEAERNALINTLLGIAGTAIGPVGSAVASGIGGLFNRPSPNRSTTQNLDLLPQYDPYQTSAQRYFPRISKKTRSAFYPNYGRGNYGEF